MFGNRNSQPFLPQVRSTIKLDSRGLQRNSTTRAVVLYMSKLFVEKLRNVTTRIPKSLLISCKEGGPSSDGLLPRSERVSVKILTTIHGTSAHVVNIPLPTSKIDLLGSFRRTYLYRQVKSGRRSSTTNDWGLVCTVTKVSTRKETGNED